MHCDHVYSFSSANDLEATLRHFERAGFLRCDHRSHHPKGMLTGFVHLTGTYLEFITIEDEAAFLRDADAAEHWLRRHPRPYGIGLHTYNIEETHRHLQTVVPRTPPIVRRRRPEQPDGPVTWAFAEFPAAHVPGCELCAIEYLTRPRTPNTLIMGPNTIFAISGFVFCTDTPADRIAVWARTLAAVLPQCEQKQHTLSFGFQQFRWITPQEFEQWFDARWIPADSRYGELCAVQVRAADLRTAAAALQDGGFAVRHRTAPPRLYVGPDPDTGYAFVVEPGAPNVLLTVLNQNAVQVVR
ncbi:MAG: VOC family protein [Deltaproteobacteria bacterium]|nr:VOC family protein [Deltaproteobacteria bacterium]